MKTNLIITVILASLFLTSCSTDYSDRHSSPPNAPSGLYAINGDGRVDLFWNYNRESNVTGYNVYFSYSYDGKYTLIGSTQNDYYIDFEALNGNRYYYAVAAYDNNGRESDLSIEEVYATPRPEGFNQAIFDYRKFPNNSGYQFSSYSVLPYDDLNTDIFFENYNGTFYLNVWDDTDIQDMGSTYDIYDIEFAPLSGWAPTKDELAKIGHTYVIWTWNNRYAKIHIKNITTERVVFDWAYQLVEGERQLKHGRNVTERKPLNREEFNNRGRN